MESTKNQAPRFGKPNTRNKKKEIFIGLGISTFTLLILLGGLEFIGLLWEQKTAQGSLGWTLVASRRLEFESRGAPNQIYFMLKPNKNYVWENIAVHINSVGLRTEEFKIPKPQGTYRILNLGDSIAFGWEVPQELSYGKQLESKLNTRNDGLHYEVINAGVPTWSPDIERNFLIQEGLKYQPDLVIVDFTIVNDVYGQGPTSLKNPGIFDWLRDHTYSWPFLTTQARFIISKRVGPEAIPVLNPPKEPQFYYPLDINDQNWARIGSVLDEMKEACDLAGAQFIVLVFPTAYQLNSSQHPDIPQRVFQSWDKNGRFTSIDLLPIYTELCNNSSPEACEGYENLLFVDVWMHPNALGHEKAAEALLDYIKE